MQEELEFPSLLSSLRVPEVQLGDGIPISH